MQLGKLRRRHSLATAVRPHLVVVLAPERDGRSSLLQRLEPLLVQTLVPKLAVEALDVAVLHGPSRLYQDVADTVRVGPGHKGAACELRAIVRAHGQRVAPEDSGLLEQPRDVLARDAPVHRDAHALVAEFVSHRQALDAPSGAQAVADEVHAPDLIDRRWVGLARSSYFYHRARLQAAEKYAKVRCVMADILERNHRCYGYRRMQASLCRQCVRLSEKRVQRLMKQECLVVAKPK
jgi:hypothetical protein